MPRKCSICVHPERAAIDSALRTEAYRVVAKRFGIGEAAANRHKTEHLPSAKRSASPKRSEAIEATPADKTAEDVAEKAKLPRGITGITQAQRDAEILERRLKGILPRKIAQEMGIGRDTVREVLARALSDAAADRTDRAAQWLEIELERLDKLQAALWDRAIDPDLVTATVPADNESGGKAYDAQDKAMDRVLKILERRHKLLGLEKAPMQQAPDKPAAPTAQRFIVEIAEPLRSCPSQQTAPTSGDSSPPIDAPGTG